MSTRPSNVLVLVITAMVGAVWPAPAQAADDGVPYWASLRHREANMRVGPGEEYRVTFRYRREDLPLKVLRVMEGWRLVQDPDGSRGWMLARFLKRDRGAIVKGTQLAEMREAPDGSGRVLWRIEPGVSGRLGDCAQGWCRFEIAGRAGFVRQDVLWGAGKP